MLGNAKNAKEIAEKRKNFLDIFQIFSLHNQAYLFFAIFALPSFKPADEQPPPFPPLRRRC
jgi:hypothetical protein